MVQRFVQSSALCGTGSMLVADSWFGAFVTCQRLLDVGVFSVLAVKTKFRGFPIKTLTEKFADLPKGGSHTMWTEHQLPTGVQARIYGTSYGCCGGIPYRDPLTNQRGYYRIPFPSINPELYPLPTTCSL